MTRSRVLPLIARLPLVALGLAGAATLAACSGSSGTASGPINLAPIDTDVPSAAQAGSSVGSSGGATDAPSSDAASGIPSSSAPSPSASASAGASVSPTPAAGATHSTGGPCATSQLTVTLGQTGGAAGSMITPLVFTNSSTMTCTLTGFPGVSFVTGSAGTQVGEPAGRNGSSRGLETLMPGGSVTALFQQANPENYPPGTCKPVTVLGLRIYPPGQRSAAFVTLPTGSTACSTTSQNGGNQSSVQAVGSSS